MKYKNIISGFEELVNQVRETIVEERTVPTGASAALLGLESGDEGALRTTGTSIEGDLLTILTDNQDVLSSLGLESDELLNTSNPAYDLATMAAMMPIDSSSLPPSVNSIDSGEDGMTVGEWNPNGINTEIGLESYDERELANLKTFTIMSNLFAGYGTKFSRSVSPVFTVSPDEAGLKLVIDLMMIQDDKKHDLSNTLMNWNRKSLAQAMINGDILEPSSTEIIPVFRKGGPTDNTVYFVDDADYNTTVKNMGAEKITTLPLKAGVKFDLKKVATHDGLVKAGLMNWTDTIEPDLLLQDIFLDIGGAKIGFDTSAEVSSGFRATQQGDNTGLYLNLNTETLLLTATHVDVKGAALPGPLDVIATNKWTVHIGTTIQGVSDIHTPNTSINMNEIHVVDVVDNATRASLDLEDAAVKPVVDAINAAKLDGFNLNGRFSNLNLRHKVPTVITRAFTANYMAGISSAVAMYRPPSQINAFKDTSRDLQSLVNITVARADNAVAAMLQQTAAKLAAHANAAFSKNSSQPELFGIGSCYVNPTYIPDTLDVAAVLNSQNSSNKMASVVSVISDRALLAATNLWLNSGMSAAVANLPVGYSKKATCVIATDPKIAGFLDMSKYSNENFDFEVVSTPNDKLTGQMYISFRFAGTATQPNPLSFSLSVQAPSITFYNNMSTENSTHKALWVMPRFNPYVTTSVLSVISVSNIDLSFKTRVSQA